MDRARGIPTKNSNSLVLLSFRNVFPYEHVYHTRGEGRLSEEKVEYSVAFVTRCPCLALENRDNSLSRFQSELTIATLLTLKGYFLSRASVRSFNFVVLTRRVLEISRNVATFVEVLIFVPLLRTPLTFVTKIVFQFVF